VADLLPLVYVPRSAIGTARKPGCLYRVLLAGFSAVMSHPFKAACPWPWVPEVSGEVGNTPI